MELGNIVCAIMDILTMIFYYNIFFEKRNIKRWIKISSIFLICMLSVSKLYISANAENNLILSIILCSVVVFLFYEGHLWNKIFSMVVYVIMAMISEIISQYILEKVLNVSYSDIGINTHKLFAPLSLAITIVILLYIKKYTTNNLQKCH